MSLDHGTTKKLAAVVAVGAEICAGAYLIFMAWLLSSWMLDDDLALRLVDSDWAEIGVKRAAVASGAGLCVAIGSALWQRFVVRRFWPTAPTMRWLPWLIGVSIATAGVAGAIRFVNDKPFV